MMLPPVAGTLDQRHCALHRLDHIAVVAVDIARDVGPTRFGKQLPSGPARHVHHYVEAWIGAFDIVVKGVERRFVSGIRGHGRDPTALRADRALCFGQRRRIDVADRQVNARLGQCQRNAGANAPAAADNRGHFPCQIRALIQKTAHSRLLSLHGCCKVACKTARPAPQASKGRWGGRMTVSGAISM